MDTATEASVISHGLSCFMVGLLFAVRASPPDFASGACVAFPARSDRRPPSAQCTRDGPGRSGTMWDGVPVCRGLSLSVPASGVAGCPVMSDESDNQPAGEKPDNAPETAEKPEATTEAPPAAETVIEGDRTEREIHLQEELDAEREARKKDAETLRQREIRVSELEDENRSLKDALKPEPVPAVKPTASKQPQPSKGKSRNAWTFFHED